MGLVTSQQRYLLHTLEHFRTLNATKCSSNLEIRSKSNTGWQRYVRHRFLTNASIVDPVLPSYAHEPPLASHTESLKITYASCEDSLYAWSYSDTKTTLQVKYCIYAILRRLSHHIRESKSIDEDATSILRCMSGMMIPWHFLGTWRKQPTLHHALPLSIRWYI